MIEETFLEKLSRQLIAEYGARLSGITIILPNKRARIFLIEAIRKQLNATLFAPEIISIEDFVQDVAGVRSLDAIELLFELYNVYVSVTSPEKRQNFETFANWGKTLLQDFNEID
ncbi:hypothetical protein VF13_38870, partial [Nostoc linckia z16]